MEMSLEKYRNESAVIERWFVNDSNGLRYLSSYADSHNWIHLINNQNRFLYIAKIIDVPIGFFDLEIKEHTGHFAFYVAPQYRAKGFGKMILHIAFALNILKQISQFEIGIDKQNKQSIAILKSFGFEKILKI